MQTGFAFFLVYAIMGVEMLYGFYLSSTGAFTPEATVDAEGCRNVDESAFITKIMVPIMSLQMLMMQASLVHPASCKRPQTSSASPGAHPLRSTPLTVRPTVRAERRTTQASTRRPPPTPRS